MSEELETIEPTLEEVVGTKEPEVAQEEAQVAEPEPTPEPVRETLKHLPEVESAPEPIPEPASYVIPGVWEGLKVVSHRFVVNGPHEYVELKTENKCTFLVRVSSLEILK